MREAILRKHGKTPNLMMGLFAGSVDARWDLPQGHNGS